MGATYQLGDVLLVTLTYSSQAGVEKRPVIVLRDVGDADMLVVPVTSQASRVAYDVPLADWPEGDEIAFGIPIPCPPFLCPVRLY